MISYATVIQVEATHKMWHFLKNIGKFLEEPNTSQSYTTLESGFNYIFFKLLKLLNRQFLKKKKSKIFNFKTPIWIASLKNKIKFEKVNRANFFTKKALMCRKLSKVTTFIANLSQFFDLGIYKKSFECPVRATPGIVQTYFVHLLKCLKDKNWIIRK
jgi:hypothetical protein